MDGVERRTMDKVSWRLAPFLMFCDFIACLDRVNVGFAGGPMRQDLGLTADQFGNAAGIFFIAYFFFEAPSNLALHPFAPAAGSRASCSPGAWRRARRRS